jgi:hypothetical protein
MKILDKLRKDSKGFGHIEMFTIVLVVAAIAGVGYFVYNRGHKVAHAGSATVAITSPVIGIAGSGGTDGYWLYSSDGGVFAEGSAPYYGSMGGKTLSAPIVGMSATYDHKGYYLVGADGAVYAFGNAHYGGGLNGGSSYGVISHPGTVIGIAAYNGGGYWIMTSTGATYALGGAPYKGNVTGQTGVMVSITTSPNGAGFYAMSSAGQGYNFDTDTSCNGTTTSQYTVGGIIINVPGQTYPCQKFDGQGNWSGSKTSGSYGYPTDASTSISPIVGETATGDYKGYWAVEANGSIFAFGDAVYNYTTPVKYSRVGSWTYIGQGSTSTQATSVLNNDYACKLVIKNTTFIKAQLNPVSSVAVFSNPAYQNGQLFLGIGSYNYSNPWPWTYSGYLSPNLSSYQSSFISIDASAKFYVALAGATYGRPPSVLPSSLTNCSQ